MFGFRHSLASQTLVYDSIRFHAKPSEQFGKRSEPNRGFVARRTRVGSFWIVQHRNEQHAILVVRVCCFCSDFHNWLRFSRRERDRPRYAHVTVCFCATARCVQRTCHGRAVYNIKRSGGTVIMTRMETAFRPAARRITDWRYSMFVLRRVFTTSMRGPVPGGPRYASMVPNTTIVSDRLTIGNWVRPM